MQIQVIPTHAFLHDRINAVAGVPLLVHESLAHEFERRGLVRIAMVPRRVDQALSVGAGATVTAAAAGKVPDDGQGQPSSALPADPPSLPGTLHLPKRGPGRPRSGT